jgi:hypothetical protein
MVQFLYGIVKNWMITVNPDNDQIYHDFEGVLYTGLYPGRFRVARHHSPT